MGLTLLTPATVFPVTLDEARAHCRVTHTDENALLTGYIKAATRYVEQNLSASIAEQVWGLTLDAFSDYIELARGPVISVDAFAYIDTAGSPQTVDSGLYTVDLVSRAPWIVRNSSSSWPTPMDGINMVSVTYTAGMGVVPEDLKHAILLLVGHWHLNREAVNVGNTVTEVPLAVDALLQPYRWVLV
jgi:uncharacterized phiE125 gp8 family phage protein